MKKYLMFLCAMALVVGMMGAANANTYKAIENPEPDKYIGWYQTYSWTFDLTLDGYVPGTEITSASIEINLRDDDDADWEGLWEFALLNVGDEWMFDWTPLGHTDTNLTAFGTMTEFGIVNASVTSWGGDFYFEDATLTATDVVPEPATVALLGIGMVGLAGAEVRRRRKKKAVDKS